MNKVRSVLDSDFYHPTTYSSASAMATEIFDRPRIQNAVQQALAQNEHDYEVRLREVSELAKGSTETIVSETTSRDGSVTTTTTKRPLSPKTRLEAHKLLFKLDGSEDARKAEARVLSDSLMQLSKRMMREKRVNAGNGDSGLTGAWGEDAPGSTSIPSPPETPNRESLGGVFYPWGDQWE